MDGDLELVIGTTSGKIYALSGKTGQDTGAFPFETRGRVMAPVRLKPTSRIWSSRLADCVSRCISGGSTSRV